MKKFIVRGFGLIVGVFALLLVIGYFLPDKPSHADVSIPQVDTKIDPHKAPLKVPVITRYRGHKDDSGMVLYETFTIRNGGEIAIKDLKIKCDNGTPSGTVIDSNTRIIYEIIPAHKTRTFRNFNMGLIDPQVTNSGCEIEDFASVQ